MENYKHETKYNIKDKVFAIKHKEINDFMNRKIESYEIYNSEIKEIKFDYFGVTYKLDNMSEYFKEKDIFLQTDEKSLFSRISELMKEKGE